MGNKTTRRDRGAKVVASEARIDVDPADERNANTKPSRAERKKRKRLRKRRQADPLPPQRLYRGGLLPEHTTKLHPDFDQPATQFDRLFETDDGGLLYFDSRHLSRVSTFFRDLLDLPLTGPRVKTGARADPIDADIAIPLHFASTPGFALLLHVLLFELQPYPVLPHHIIEDGFLAALVNAQECADRFEIGWYGKVIQPHILPSAERLKSSQPFEALALVVMANHTPLIKEITWSTLAHPLENMSIEIVRLLEDRDPDLLIRLRELHTVVKPAAVQLKQSLVEQDVIELPQEYEEQLPDCRRYACAITTGYDLVPGEVSTTRRLAAEKVMEGLFMEDKTRPKIDTIVSRMNTCELCNMRLAVLLQGLVIKFERSYKSLC